MKRLIIRIVLPFACCLPISFSLARQVTDASGIALAGARIYPSPDAAPIDNGVVLVRNGRIIAVGSQV